MSSARHPLSFAEKSSIAARALMMRVLPWDRRLRELGGAARGRRSGGLAGMSAAVALAVSGYRVTSSKNERHSEGGPDRSSILSRASGSTTASMS